MINSKRLVIMTRKWQKIAAMGRRRISMASTSNSVDNESCRKSVADKGHFVVYTDDGRRFVVPLQYLKSPVLVEMFRVSEDSFGLTCNGPITLPCDGVFMEHVISLLRRRRMSKEVEKALVFTIVNQQCSTSYMQHPHQQKSNQQILIHGF